MGQGRAQWQALASLGEEAQQLKHELATAKKPSISRTGTAELEEAWKLFEAQQELEKLKKQKQMIEKILFYHPLLTSSCGVSLRCN